MKALKILYVGTGTGSSGDRCKAFRRMGHDATLLDPRLLLPSTSLIDHWIWRTGALGLPSIVKKRVLAAIDGKSFDLVFVSIGELLSASLVQELKERFGLIVNYNNDDPFGGRDMKKFSLYLEAVPYYDLIVVLRACNIEEARQAGAKQVLHVTMSADEVQNIPRELTQEDYDTLSSEVSFIGTWMPERGPFLARLVELGVPLSIWGDRWDKSPEWYALKPHWRGPAIINDLYAKTLQCSKVSIGLLSKGNRDQTTFRSFEIPMLGGVLCAERTPEHLSLYREGVEAVFWSTPEECAEKCHALLKDPAWRASISREGQKRCLANGTTNERILQRILDTLMAADRVRTGEVAASR